MKKIILTIIATLVLAASGASAAAAATHHRLKPYPSWGSKHILASSSVDTGWTWDDR